MRNTALSLSYFIALLLLLPVCAGNEQVEILKKATQLTVADQEPVNASIPSNREFQKALELQKGHHWSQAADCYQRSICKNSSLFASYFNQGLCFEQLGQYAKAEKSFLAALRIDKLSREANKHLASVYFKLGLDEKALKFADRYLDL
jgi:tetratricopeptide (TPR) repeat protein